MSVKSNLTIYQRYQRYYEYLYPIASDPIIRGYFSLVASILLIAFFLVFALSPTFNTIVSLQKKITDQKTIISALDAKISALVIAQDVFSQVESQVPLVKLALPDKPVPQGIVTDVLSAASSSGVAIVSLQFQQMPLSKNAPAKITVSNGLPTVVFSASVTGAEDKVRSFVANLEKRLRYIRLKSLTVSLGAADITGLGYYYE